MEVRDALQGLPLEILAPADFGITESPYETGETFKENARQKAWFYFERSKGMPTLADDSGIIVEALKNELGIHTRRWGAGQEASDHHWITFFLERIREEQNKHARFVCTLCFVEAKGEEHVFEGCCDGTITNETEADYLPGLPISACFKPNGYDQVYAAIPVEEKNRISHRGKALQKFSQFLQSQVENPLPNRSE